MLGGKNIRQLRSSLRNRCFGKRGKDGKGSYRYFSIDSTQHSSSSNRASSSASFCCSISSSLADWGWARLPFALCPFRRRGLRCLRGRPTSRNSIALFSLRWLVKTRAPLRSSGTSNMVSNDLQGERGGDRTPNLKRRSRL